MSVKLTIDIDAPPQRVWDVLTDPSAYAEWSTVLHRLDGPLVPGKTVHLDIDVGFRRVDERVRLREVEPPHALGWGAVVGSPWVLEFHHWFRIEPRDGGSRLIHAEDFTGAVGRVLGALVNSRLEAVYQRFNEELKARAEQG